MGLILRLEFWRKKIKRQFNESSVILIRCRCCWSGIFINGCVCVCWQSDKLWWGLSKTSSSTQNSWLKLNEFCLHDLRYFELIFKKGVIISIPHSKRFELFGNKEKKSIRWHFFLNSIQSGYVSWRNGKKEYRPD